MFNDAINNTYIVWLIDNDVNKNFLRIYKGLVTDTNPGLKWSGAGEAVSRQFLVLSV